MDGDTLKEPSLYVATRVVYEVTTFIMDFFANIYFFQWEDITFVTAEIVGPTHSGLLLNALKNGKVLWGKLELKPEGEFLSFHFQL